MHWLGSLKVFYGARKCRIRNQARLKHQSFIYEGHALNEEIINQILELEKQAQKIHDDAQLKAGQIVQQAQQDADQLRQSAEKLRQKKVQQLLAEAGEEAKRERDRILDETSAEIEKLKAQAETHKQGAVQYVINRVTWRE